MNARKLFALLALLIAVAALPNLVHAATTAIPITPVIDKLRISTLAPALQPTKTMFPIITNIVRPLGIQSQLGICHLQVQNSSTSSSIPQTTLTLQNMTQEVPNQTSPLYLATLSFQPKYVETYGIYFDSGGNLGLDIRNLQPNTVYMIDMTWGSPFGTQVSLQWQDANATTPISQQSFSSALSTNYVASFLAQSDGDYNLTCTCNQGGYWQFYSCTITGIPASVTLPSN